jgi:hypothetical protein
LKLRLQLLPLSSKRGTSVMALWERQFSRRKSDRKRPSNNTHYMFISVNAKSVFSWGHSGRSSGHPAPLHRQATIIMVVCRPQRFDPTHLITGPSRSSSTPLESPQRRELIKLFETDPSQKQFGFSIETQINIRSKAPKLDVRSRACLALGFAPVGFAGFRFWRFAGSENPAISGVDKHDHCKWCW